MSKSATVFIFDVSTSMKNGNEEDFELAKKIFLMQIKNKLFNSPKDEVGFLLVGSGETDNHLNDDDEESYLNIEHKQPIIPVGIPLYQEIQNLNFNSSSDHCDVLGSLIVAYDMIDKKVGKKKYEKSILIFTNGASDTEEDQKTFSKFKKSLHKKGVVVRVVAINFDASSCTTQTQKLLRELKDQKTNDADADDDDAYHIFSLNDALYELSGYQNKKRLQRGTNFDFEIGDFKIPVQRFKKAEKVSFPKISRYSKLSIEAQENDDEQNKEYSGKVSNQRQYTMLDDPDVIVEVEETVKAYRYGKNLVPISKVSEGSMTLVTTKCFQLLGTVPRELIKREHFMGESYVVAVRQKFPKSFKGNIEGLRKAFTTLVHCMVDNQKVAIVRMVFRKNSTPKVIVLHPVFDGVSSYFIFNELPFIEDIRDYQFKPFDDINLSEDQLSATEDLIKKLDLTRRVTEDDDEEDTSIVRVDMGDNRVDKRYDTMDTSKLFNPTTRYFYDCVQERVMKEKSDPTYNTLQEVDEVILQKCMPEVSQNSSYSKMMEEAKDEIDRFDDLFKTEKVETKTGKKRTFTLGSESLDDPTQSLGQPNKRQKIGSSEEISIFREKKKLTTTNPVKEFKDIISDGDEHVDFAMESMTKVIKELLSASVGNAYYEKAMDSVEILRSTCIEKKKSSVFNILIKSLKTLYSKNDSVHAEFWGIIKRKGITLIASTESNDSNVSTEDAAKFHEEEQISTAVIIEEEKDEDDMFDELD